mmetsp:Transcript_15983/g.13964  ORF Transcript_15983/g.13964 Transcript_15983/m.13964 type:complete len:148 (+) Transcript_15983:590-1033(+)
MMVLDRIDPNNQYIHHRLYRDSCLPCNKNFIKDLSVIGRDIEKTIIVDNSMIAFALNIDNAIPIESYIGDKNDNELAKLVQIIDSAINFTCTSPTNDSSDPITETPPNLRDYLTSIFKLKERISFWKNHFDANKEVQTSSSANILIS